MQSHPLHHGTLFLASSVLLIGCHRSAAYSRPLTPVRVHRVVAVGPRRGVRYSGRVEAATQVTLAFKVGGYVRTITRTSRGDGRRRLLQAGDPVRSSAVLAVIRKSDYATKLDELRGTRDHARASVVNAKLELDRATELLPQKVIPQAEYDSYKARYDAFVGEALAADARVSQAAIALSDTALKSPLDGIVLDRAIEVGDLVSPGTTGFVVADTSHMKIVFGVPDSVQQTLTTGLPVSIDTEALPGRKFRGLLTKIAAKADEKSRLFDVEASVDNPDQALRVGLIATVELESAAAPARAVAPLSAVVQIPGQKGTFAVFVIARRGEVTVATLRQVVLGDLVGNDLSIADGLVEGEEVVVRGANIVRDGERVAIIP
jgi:multidrug efflux system membrane fusion protein